MGYLRFSSERATQGPMRLSAAPYEVMESETAVALDGKPDYALKKRRILTWKACSRVEHRSVRVAGDELIGETVLATT